MADQKDGCPPNQPPSRDEAAKGGQRSMATSRRGHSRIRAKVTKSSRPMMKLLGVVSLLMVEARSKEEGAGFRTRVRFWLPSLYSGNRA